jgi:hypothetical protein
MFDECYYLGYYLMKCLNYLIHILVFHCCVIYSEHPCCSNEFFRVGLLLHVVSPCAFIHFVASLGTIVASNPCNCVTIGVDSSSMKESKAKSKNVLKEEANPSYKRVVVAWSPFSGICYCPITRKTRFLWLFISDLSVVMF